MIILNKVTLNEAKGQAVDHLNLIRGIAAIIVLVHHTRQQFFYDFETLKNPTLFETIFYFFTAFGQEAVRIFFVLSGYFIGLSVLKTIKAAKWSWRNYLTSRLTRLLLVLYPALLLCAFWDKLGMTLFGYQSYGSNAARFTLENALGNAVFLQNIIVEPFGTNDPLWSLSYEFWYYFLFPLGVLAILPGRPLRNRLFYGFLFICTSYFVGLEIMLSFSIWLLGAAIVIVPVFTIFTKSKFWLVSALVLSISSLLIILAVSRTKRLGLGFNFVGLLTAFAAAITIYFILYLRIPRQFSSTTLYSCISKRMAGCSYTLYLIHSPILVFLATIIYINTGAKWIPSLNSIFLSCIVMIGVFGFALLLAYFTEGKTEKVRRWIENKFQKSKMNKTFDGNTEKEELIDEKLKV